MPNYRRFYVPGGTVFLTVTTYRRLPYLTGEGNVGLLRDAVAQVKQRWPFEFLAGVVLPDHLHFLWSLPPGDSDYSRRIGRMKVLFTRSLRGPGSTAGTMVASRQKHREGEVWQRRFWEHTIQEGEDLEAFLHHIHYNPVKHGHATCPHLWPHSSFDRWVRDGLYPPDWVCRCGRRDPVPPRIHSLHDLAGE